MELHFYSSFMEHIKSQSLKLKHAMAIFMCEIVII